MTPEDSIVSLPLRAVILGQGQEIYYAVAVHVHLNGDGIVN